MPGNVLILGGSGRFGRNAAEAFWNAGWRVRLFDRATDTLPEAALGADVIVNGWNPTYDKWEDEVPRLTAQVIEAARESGATVIQLANVYVYGAGAPALLGQNTPHSAKNPLGRIRIEMEEALRASGVRTILLRAGEFIDTEASGNWLDRVILASLPKGAIRYPGDPEAPHAWAYLPDLAEAARQLAERRETLPAFAEVLFPGYTLSGRDVARLASGITGKPVRVKRFAWLPVQLARPVWPMARHLVEMRYLWSLPHAIDPSGFEAVLPGFRHTAPEVALAAAIEALTHAPRPTPRGTGQGFTPRARGPLPEREAISP